MKEIPQASIFHVVVEEKVPRRGQGITLKADKIPMLDAPNRLKLRLELLEALWVLGVESLNRHWPAVFEDTLVYGA